MITIKSEGANGHKRCSLDTLELQRQTKKVMQGKKYREIIDRSKLKHFHIEVAGVRRLEEADTSECIENGHVKQKLKIILH